MRFSSSKGNSQIERQLVGTYTSTPSSKDESLPLGMIQESWATSSLKDGVRFVSYRSNELIHVRLLENMSTLIQFSSGEEILKFEIGDASVVKAFKLQEDIISLIPQNFVGVQTTLNIIGTSGTVYTFVLHIHGYNSKDIPDLRLNVKPPREKYLRSKVPDLKEGTSPSSDYLEKLPIDLNNVHFNFAMSGSKEIAPKRVYSDGIRTWFNYGDRINKIRLPVIFNVVDGIDQPINVVRKGNKIMAFGRGTFSLKSGKQVTRVWPTKGG